MFFTQANEAFRPSGVDKLVAKISKQWCWFVEL